MFTGIVEEKGKLVNVTKKGISQCLTISGNIIFQDLKIGDSVCVNGVCLTATTISNNVFTADVMSETINRSNLFNLRNGSTVNLERAMSVNGRFGGHIVSGHIDGIGSIIDIKKDNISVWFTIKTTSDILKYVVEKGSIAIDGISLTVAKVTDNSFSVSIIPHTISETILFDKKVNDTVNLECDIFGKYVEKFFKMNNEKENNNKNNDKDLYSLLKSNSYL